MAKEEIFETGLSPENLKAARSSWKWRGITGIAGPAARTKVGFSFDLERVKKLMDGAIDIHIHSGPSAIATRLGTDLDLAKQACQAGMAAVVFKDPPCPTARSARVAQDAVNQWAEENGKKKIDVFGGLVLNYPVGGLNPEAVLACAKIGGKYVWTATDSSHKRELMGQPPGGVDVADENGNILPAMKEILSIIAEADMVLGVDSMRIKTAFTLIDEAKKMGVKRIEVVHPNEPACKMTPEQMKIAADKGTYIGIYCFDFSPPEFSWDEFFEVVKVVGSDRIIMATDQGIFFGLYPVEAMRIFMTVALYRGIPDKDVEKMVKINPRNLLY